MSTISWYHRWNNFLTLTCSRILAKRLTHPIYFILVPLLVVLAIAYPAIYSVYVQPSLLITSLTYSPTKHIKDVQFVESNAYPQGVLRAITIETSHSDGNLLNSTLLESLTKIQSELLNGVPTATAHSVLHSHGPFVQWYSDNNEFQVIDKVSKLNGLIKAVGEFRIMTYLNTQFNDTLTSNIDSVRQRYPDVIVNELGSLKTFDTVLRPSSWFDILLIYTLIPALLAYHAIKIYQLKSIRSKLGLLLAFIGQFIISGFASVSIISIFSFNMEFLQIPFTLIIAIPLLVNVENVSRLAIMVNMYSNELSFVSRLRSVIQNSFPVSTNFNLFAISTLFLAWTLTKSQLCLFNIIYILVNYALTYTYFITVLIVDFKKLQLRDINININIIDKVKRTKMNESFDYIPSFLLVAVLSFIVQWNTNTDISIIYNKRGFVHDISPASSVQLPISLPPTTIENHYNILYLVEFTSFLLFVSSTLFIILNLTMSKIRFPDYSRELINQSSPSSCNMSPASSESSNMKQYFHSKDLINGHVLDVVKLCTSACPFIVSVGIDHKLLVWSPLKNPIPKPTELPITPDFLPISDVVMSDSGSFITVLNKSGHIKCFSRLSMSWTWSLIIEELQNDVPLDSFYRKRTQVSSGRRKLVSRTAAASSSSSSNAASKRANAPRRALPPKVKKESSEAVDVTEPKPETAPKSPSMTEKIAMNSTVLRPGRSLSLDSNFNHSVNLKKLTYNSDMEFIIILRNGTVYSIDCTTGSLEKSVLSTTPLLCAKKLVSPRVNDRIVGIKEDDGELIVATAVNNKWRSRPVKIDANNYNSGKSLITPAILEEIDLRAPEEPKKIDLTNLVITTVPFVGMIVRAFGTMCQLIDVQTGIVLKEWAIEKFNPSTFKVFHPEPSHCRFCGCASVPSFSIAYNKQPDNLLMMHTFSIDNRAKNNICLRVERDSRETRCLGFASVSEHIHTLDHVEGWCSTYMNMLMGIRRKVADEETLNNTVADSQGVLRRRIGVASGSTGSTNSNATNGNKTFDFFSHNTHKLSDDWQGWTLSAQGKLRFYEIPEGADSGLLIKKLGPVRKFGHKSIVVSFGNVMKVLYLGNDSLIEEGEADTSAATGNPVYQSSSSLSFINRRRKLRMKKYDLTHSTNFEDSIELPIEE